MCVKQGNAMAKNGKYRRRETKLNVRHTYTNSHTHTPTHAHTSTHKETDKDRNRVSE